MHIRILSTILPILIACAGFGCTPLDTTDAEATAEAQGAIIMYNDMTIVKGAIDNGASHNHEHGCLVISNVSHWLVYTAGGEGERGTWSLATSESGNYRINGSVFDRIAAGAFTTEPGELQFMLTVPDNTYLPSIGQYTEGVQRPSLNPGVIGETPFALLGSP